MEHDTRGTTDATLERCQEELVAAVAPGLRELLDVWGSDVAGTALQRIAAAMAHNQPLHFSRTSVVHAFVMRIFGHDLAMQDALRQLSLLATLNEGIVDDIAARQRSPRGSDCAWFVRAYAPMVLPLAIHRFAAKIDDLVALPDDEGLERLICGRMATFYDDMAGLAELEGKLMAREVDDPGRALQELCELRTRMTSVSAFIVLYPLVRAGVFPDSPYRRLLQYLEALHALEEHGRAHARRADDRLAGRFNVWALLEDHYSELRGEYVNHLVGTLGGLDAITRTEYPQLASLLEPFARQRRILLDRLAPRTAHMGTWRSRSCAFDP